MLGKKMKKILLVTMLLQITLLNIVNSEQINYQLIKDIKLSWMNGYTIRYLNTFDSLCLGYLDSLQYDKELGIHSMKIYKTLPLCEVAGKSTGDGYSDASVIDLKFISNAIEILVSTTPLEPRGEEIRKCIVYVNRGEFSELECDDPKPINELTSDQLRL